MAKMKYNKYSVRERIYKEGDPVKDFHFIYKGRVETSIPDPTKAK